MYFRFEFSVENGFCARFANFFSSREWSELNTLNLMWPQRPYGVWVGTENRIILQWTHQYDDAAAAATCESFRTFDYDETFFIDDSFMFKSSRSILPQTVSTVCLSNEWIWTGGCCTDSHTPRQSYLVPSTKVCSTQYFSSRWQQSMWAQKRLLASSTSISLSHRLTAVVPSTTRSMTNRTIVLRTK